MDSHVPALPDADARTRAMRSTVLRAVEEPAALRLAQRMPARLAVTAAVALLLASVMALPGGGGASKALAITTANGWFEMSVSDASASPETMTEELRDAGVDGQVRAVPVRPALVGDWVAIDEASADGSSGAPEKTIRFGPAFHELHETLRLKLDELHQPGVTYVFYIGRAAAPGEAYAFDGGPNEPGR